MTQIDKVTTVRSAVILSDENVVDLRRHTDGTLEVLSIDFDTPSIEGYSERRFALWRALLPEIEPAQSAWISCFGHDTQLAPLLKILLSVDGLSVLPFNIREEVESPQGFITFSVLLDRWFPADAVAEMIACSLSLNARCWDHAPDQDAILNCSMADIRTRAGLVQKQAIWSCFTSDWGEDVGFVAVDDALVEAAFARAAAL